MILELDDVRVAHRREHHELALDVPSRVHRSLQQLERDLVLLHVEPLGDVDLAEHALAEEPHEPVVPAHDVVDARERRLGRRRDLRGRPELGR